MLVVGVKGSSDGFSDRVRTRRNIPGLERQSGYGFSSGFASSGFAGEFVSFLSLMSFRSL